MTPAMAADTTADETDVVDIVLSDDGITVEGIKWVTRSPIKGL